MRAAIAASIVGVAERACTAWASSITSRQKRRESRGVCGLACLGSGLGLGLRLGLEFGLGDAIGAGVGDQRRGVGRLAHRGRRAA